MKKQLTMLALLVSTFSGLVHADDSAIQQALKKLGLQQTEIQPSPLPGIKTVLTESGVLYVTDDGKHMIQGPLYDVSGAQPVNVTNQLLETKVKALEPQMIIYKAPKEQHVITVFTDITCGYCRKLHEQMADYNALGITVRYLAFPREGLHGQVEKAMKAIWCSADRNKQFDEAMKGNAPQMDAPATCKIDLDQQYKLGILFGIQGTPAILTDSGMMIPGYQGPQELKQALDGQKSGG
ncbi:bifunctional protein-disulfide isomerase/oxidoreductase DsbC [Pantoea sp. At-9b]|jgi:thiol:disulfide interchange protein DsbC|uniref:bifunctional protein-disulfide isomerase/oxidoreductase DsbC n=1 Tax=Pantoea sp. (strain At-9b) TaxID=592316 RepID=UPI0001B3DF28|nr:bifunctional protein-disulfide isomerase/oxidoreductase DsbC [Pantoea sp. At-9b]ADU70471.1 disulfide bond isomerase, DsbC/G-like protein [Pantoea sp. At-9b]